MRCRQPSYHGVERNKLLLFFKTFDRQQMHFLDIGIIRTKEVALKSCWLSFGQDINFSLIQDVRLVKCTSQIFMFHSILVVCAIIRPRKLLNQTSRQQMLSFNESLETSILWNTQTHSHLCINTQPLQKYTSTSFSNKQRYPVT